MLRFLQLSFIASSAGAILLAIALARIVLRDNPGGGNWIGGLGVLVGMLFLIAFALVLLGAALLAAALLARRGERLWLRWFGALLISQLVFAASVALWRQRLDERALRIHAELLAEEQKELEDGKAIVARPESLKTYAASHPVNSVIAGIRQTPLEAALARGYWELAAELLRDGARASDSCLLSAMRARQPALLASLIAKAGTIGFEPLREAFDEGQEETLAAFVAHGASTNQLARELANGSRYLDLLPGDTNWSALAQRWQDRAACPTAIQEALQATAGDGPLDEAAILKALHSVMPEASLHRALARDPRLRARVETLLPWTKELEPDGVFPAAIDRQLNRASLAALYAGLVPPYGASKASRMMSIALRRFEGKAGEDGAALVAQVIYDRDVDLLDLLAREGFELPRLAAPDLRLSSFSEAVPDRRMRSALVQRGVSMQP